MLVLTGCTLTGEYVPPSATPDLPSVQFLQPQNNHQVVDGEELLIDLLATDNTQGISRVELFVDSFSDGIPYQTTQPIDAEAVPTFTARMNWLANGIGQHPLTAVAYRADGIKSFDVTIIVEVIPADGSVPDSPTTTPEASSSGGG